MNMSSFNTVTKIKYTDNASDLVALNEYIIFQDDKAKRKYIIFKFTNNVTQQLLGMKFEVCQYNVDGDLIEKSIVVYDKYLAKAEEEFVPRAKLRVSFDCSTISVRLMEAAFDRFVWKEGEYQDSLYKFGNFIGDEKKSSGKSGGAGGKGAQPKKANGKKEKVKRSKRPFTIRDEATRNIARFPKVFNVLIILAVLAFVITTLVLYKKDGKRYTSGDYMVRITASGDAAVYGYQGSESNLVIPEKIDGRNVARIDSGAFKNSNVSSVTFNSKVTIDTGAFVNCTKLTRINSKYEVFVLEGAFQNCPNLIYQPD